MPHPPTPGPERTIRHLHVPGLLRLVLVASAASVASVVSVACAGQANAPTLSAEPRLNDFARELEESLEAHAWERVLALADPGHYRVQVTEHGMPEPQYVAELFGLHRTDNHIGAGSEIGWSDLERIDEVRLGALIREGERHTLTGDVLLAGGERLELLAWIVEEEGELRLSGGVG